MDLMNSWVSVMIKYPADYNPIQGYWNKIQSGEEVVCKKIFYTYQKVVADLHNKNSEFYYSSKRANHAIEFIENYCKHSKR